MLKMLKLARKISIIYAVVFNVKINPLNADLHPICHLVALLGAHHILHVSRIRVKYIHVVGKYYVVKNKYVT